MWRHLVAQAAVLGTLLVVVFVATMPSSPLPARERRHRDPGVTDEQAAVFEVLDDLFPYEVAGRPFVEIEFAVEGWHPEDRHGFLIGDDGASFRVQFLDGERANLQTNPKASSVWKRASYAAADLHEHGLELVREGRRRSGFAGPEYGQPIAPLTRALLAARALARLGRTDECVAVWRELPPEWRSLAGLLAEPEKNTGFVRDLVNRVTLDTGDVSLSWNDLLERHDRFLVHVTNHHLTAAMMRVRRTEILDVLETNGAWWKDSTQRTIDALRATARVTRTNRWSGTFVLERLEPDPLAHAAWDRIVAAGLEHVPDLIAALNDDTPTRSIDYYSGKGGASIDVKNVREVATRALEVLYGGDDVIRTQSLISRMTAADWQAWYARVRETGLRPFLAAKMRDDADAVDAAKSYLTLWPDDASAVLDVALAAEGDARSNLLRLVADAAATTDRTIRDRLVEVLRSAVATDTSRRAFAAGTLLELGDSHGAETLRAAWQRGETFDHGEWPVMLSSGLPDVWTQVEARLDEAETRRSLVHSMKLRSRHDLVERAADSVRPAIDATLQRCLLRLLTDTTTPASRSATEPGTPVWFGKRNVSMHRASVADLAAHALAVGWGGAFTFDPRQPGFERRSQLAELLHRLGLTATIADAPEVRGPSAVVGTVTFEDDALPDDARSRIAAFTGETFDLAKVTVSMQRISRDHRQVIALHCEAPPGCVLVVRCASRPVADHDRTLPEVELVCTRDGETVRTAATAVPDAPEFSFVFRR